MNTTALRHARTARATIVLLAATAALAGCATEPLPPAERPEVVWQDGKPEGPLEDSPWVQAVRASELELSVAAYTRDFSSPALYETTGVSEVGRMQRGVIDGAEKGDWWFPVGPRPMIPVHVRKGSHPNERIVYMCVARSYSISAQDPVVDSPLRGWFNKYKVEQRGGQYVVTQVTGSNEDGVAEVLGDAVVGPFLDDREDSDCDLADAKVGLFDPPPDPTLEYGPEDLKLPGSAE